MSATETRIDYATAMRSARWLAARWQLCDDSLVGSLRRMRADVGDIEFIAPMPAAGCPDDLYARLEADFGPPVSRPPELWDPGPPRLDKDSCRWLGVAIKGLNPAFRYCQLQVHGQSGRAINVEIHRYDAGPRGNRGWIQLMRTGPELFGKGVLIQYKIHNHMSAEFEASHKGYFRDRDGALIATPTELAVFDLCRCLYVEPQMRREETVLSLVWMRSSEEHIRSRLGAAMKALEIPNMADLDRRWREQQLAAAAAAREVQ